MINLLKSNLYRLIRQPSTWLFLAFTVINTGIACFSCGLMFGDAPWIREYTKTASAMMKESGFGVDFETLISSVTMSVRSAFEFSAYGILGSFGLLLSPTIIMIFFIVAFILREKAYGFVKNLLPVYSRNRIEAGNLMMILIFSAVITLIGALTGVLLSGFFYASAIPSGSFLRFLVYYFTETLLLTVIGIFILILMEIFRRPFWGGLLAIVYFSLGSAVFYGILSGLVSGIAGKQVQVQAYLPFGCISSMIYSDDGSLRRSMIVALIFGAVLVALRFYMVKNKELKDTI